MKCAAFTAHGEAGDDSIGTEPQSEDRRSHAAAGARLPDASLIDVAQLIAEMRPELAWIREIRAPVRGPKSPRDHDRPGSSFRLRAAAT